MTNPENKTKTPKPKGPTQTERIQTRMDNADTRTLTEQLTKVVEANQPAAVLLDQYSSFLMEGTTLAQYAGNERTGGVTILGKELPMFDNFNDVTMATILGPSHKKYQHSRKAIATAIEQAQGLGEKVEKDIAKRVNGIIAKQKGGRGLVQTYQRHLIVNGLELFSPGKTHNNIQFTTGGTFIELSTTLPVQRFDVADKLELIGDNWSELEATRLLQKEITQHVAAMSNHLPTLSMASGVSIDPEGGMNLRRVLTVTARLWHGTATVSARQWQLTQKGDGKLNRSKEEVLTFLPLVQEEASFDGAAAGMLVINVTVGYRFKVKRDELDEVLSGLSMLLDTEMPLYNAVENGLTLAEHYRTIGIVSDEDDDVDPETELPDDQAEVALDELEDDVIAQGAQSLAGTPTSGGILAAEVAHTDTQENLPELSPVAGSLTMTDEPLSQAASVALTTAPVHAVPESNPDDDEVILF